MMLTWLKAKDAVDAGAALADSLPPQTAGNALREFIQKATQELRALELNFYKRARFANAFKWRLLENGVEAETAHDITQTLLVNAFVPAGKSAPARAPSPQAGSPANVQPVSSRKSLDALSRQAQESLAGAKYEDAVAQYQQYVAARPKDGIAFNNLGVALMKLGRHEEADVQLRKAIALNPKHADPHSNLGSSLLQRGQFYEAETSLRHALSLKPTDLTARSNLGQALVLTGKLDTARTEFAKVLRVAPRNEEALCGLGFLERSDGNFVEAESMFRRALEADPKAARAWAGLAGLRRMTEKDSQWLAGAEQAAASTTNAPDEATIRFAIGKYFDDLGQYPQAFKNYQRANELLKPLAPAYDADVHARFVDDLTRVYSRQAIADAKAGGTDSTRPVFVIGMPRSGTSLTEQILASHPAVAGAGELRFWNDVVRHDEALVRRQLLPQQTRQKIATDYLATLKRHCPDAEYVVDKTPLNADYVGLIHSVFPNARFIHMGRDPIDTCLSCFFRQFTLAVNFSFDLTDLASYYTEHARLIRHWREVLPPGTMLDVPYEELVSGQEQWTRKILTFLGLEWDERCLKFNETQRPVVTASYWQVRQRIYGSSVQRWRNYSKFVGPLRKLKPA